MSKRQEMRERQRRKQSRNRLWVILFITIGALLISFSGLPHLLTYNTITLTQY